MPLIALLVALGLVGLLLGRFAGAPTTRPGTVATPAETIRGVQQATDAASRAEQQQRDAAIRVLP